MSGPVGLALIGLGSKWGRQLAQAAVRSDQVNLLTCYARTPETRREFAREFGCHPAESVEAAITTPGVVGAIIAAPAHVHLEIALLCARQGLHVFVEKPLALTVGDSLLMLAEFERVGRVLMVNHEMRRLGSSRAMKQVVESGRLGHVVTAVATLSLTGSISTANWRGSRETNRGGALMQLGIHQIETLTYLLGPVVRVAGMFSHTVSPADIDDVGAVQMLFASGAVGVVTSSYVSPKTYRLHLLGEEANLDCVADMSIWPDAVRVDQLTRLTLQNASGLEPVPIAPQDVLVVQLDEFAASIRGEAHPETGGREGLAAVAVVEAALRSYETGVAVDPRTLLNPVPAKEESK